MYKETTVCAVVKSPETLIPFFIHIWIQTHLSNSLGQLKKTSAAEDKVHDCT
jgi:hypothetical protein